MEAWGSVGNKGVAFGAPRYKERGAEVALSIKPELLAPAGNETCLHAAVSAGADAVYLGLDEFNARRNADNFTLETLPGVCEYAHLRGVSIYVTMNIEILPSEFQRAIDLARGVHDAGADGVIVQDVGLAAEIKRAVPGLPLHISTQMNTHSAAGIEAAARLGAKRVTLARELSIEEIAELAQIAADFGMEIETFAHGALCVCYSGQCLMSSMIGGRSANRGLCAQACRLPYELHSDRREGALPAEGEHLLSPRDLCTIDILDKLAEAGVASLKIEGRMKSADYVHEVVSVYREVLDSGMPANETHRARLAEAFSRGFTTAYLEGRRGNDIMSYGRPNNRGVFAGRVARAEDGFAEVKPEIELNDGDVLEFWTNKGHFAATLASAKASSNGTVRIAVEQRVGKGDRVFRVRNAATAFVDDAMEPRVPVRGSVELNIGCPAHVVFEALACDGAECKGEAWGDIVEMARTRPVSEEDVRSHIDRMGTTPFFLEDEASLTVEMSDGIGIGFSQLHHLRADALGALKANMLESYAASSSGESEAACAGTNMNTRSFSQAAVGEISPEDEGLRKGESFPAAGRQSSVTSERTCKVVAWATNPSCARAAKRAGADAVYVPVLNFRRGQSVLAGIRQDDPEQAGYPKQCVMALPTIDHDPLPSIREYQLSFDLWDYVREGKLVYADSLASVIRAIDCGARVEVGSHVPITNAATLAVFNDLGVERAWLSPELTLGQIDDIARASAVELGVTVIGSQELMITEHCLLMSQGPCNEQCEACPRRSTGHRLVDRKGFDFPVVTDMLGRSHLYNGIELDIAQNIVDLIDIGITAVMVDTTLMDKKGASEAVNRAVRARDLALSERKAISKRSNTTTGHLFRGVS